MDHGSFDRIARQLGGAGSRRAALGALLGAGIVGVSEVGAAKKNRKDRKNRRKGDRAKGGVSAQAICNPTPESGDDISGCDYTDAEFDGIDIHGSTMRNTIFRRAHLVNADLHGSAARGASFRQADLCGAKLYSSNLREVNFQDADLTKADLHSSGGCGSANFAGATFCQTIDCGGNLNNSGCPGVDPALVCCVDDECPVGFTCRENVNRCCATNGTNIGSEPATLCCSGFKCPSGLRLNQCRANIGQCPA